MSFITSPESSNKLAEQATRTADQAIRATQRSAQAGLDGMAETASALRQDALPVLDRVADQASTLAHRGIDALQQAKDKARDRALHASDSTLDYIRHEPVKATLIAAATGAALMGLAVMLSRTRSHR